MHFFNLKKHDYPKFSNALNKKENLVNFNNFPINKVASFLFFKKKGNEIKCIKQTKIKRKNDRKVNQTLIVPLSFSFFQFSPFFGWIIRKWMANP
jgi:hypothetical protein